MSPAEYTGFEIGGYDEDAPSDIVEIPQMEHHLHKQTPVTAIHDDNAFGKVFDQAQKNHDGKFVVSIDHKEHPHAFGKSQHTYAIENRPIARVRRNL